MVVSCFTRPSARERTSKGPELLGLSGRSKVGTRPLVGLSASLLRTSSKSERWNWSQAWAAFAEGN